MSTGDWRRSDGEDFDQQPLRPPWRRRLRAPLLGGDGLGGAWIDWTCSVEHLATSAPDLARLARRRPTLVRKLLRDARAALPRLQRWIAELEAAATEAERTEGGGR